MSCPGPDPPLFMQVLTLHTHTHKKDAERDANPNSPKKCSAFNISMNAHSILMIKRQIVFTVWDVLNFTT